MNPSAATTSVEERRRAAVLGAVAAAGLAGATAAQAAAATGLDAACVPSCMADLLARGRLRTLAKPAAYVAAALADDLLGRVLERLRKRHLERPWLMGLTSVALANALSEAESSLVRVLAGCVERGMLAYRAGYYSTPGFTPLLTADQQAFFADSFAAPDGGAPGPLGFAALRARMKASVVPELAGAFETLVARGELSKVGDYVYRGADIAAIRARLETALRSQGQLTVAEFRTLTGTSRKYAVPLLEFFDATGVTQRSGNVRSLPPSTGAPRGT
jgi:selenocysteine-specific elongation factor